MRRLTTFLCFTLTLLLCSCSVNVTAENGNGGGYSRKEVSEFTSSPGFGYRKTADDIYTVFEYVYNDSALAERFGEDFEAEFIGGSFQGKTQYLPFFWEGEGKYSVSIDGVGFLVTVEKPLFGELTVTSIEEQTK